MKIVRDTIRLPWVMSVCLGSVLGSVAHGADDITQIIVNPEGDAHIEWPTDVDGTLFFTAVTTNEGRELWKSDGTQSGTALIKDIFPGPTFSNPQFLTNVDGTLFFTADDGLIGYELWKSDGTSEGTLLVSNILTEGLSPVGLSSFPANLTDFNGVLYFSARGTTGGRELWKSDGTLLGTVQIADINATFGSIKGDIIIFPSTLGSFPENFTPYAGELFFTADDGVTGRELWKTDGTALGTVQVADINVQTFVGSDPEHLTVSGGVLYFAADDGVVGRELWRFNGVATELVVDIVDFEGSFPEELTDVDGTLVLTALTPNDGRQLGSVTGDTAEPLPTIGGGPTTVPYGLTAVNETLGFSVDDGVIGVEPWKAEDGFFGPVRDIHLSGDSNPNFMTKVGRRVYFSAIDGVHGWELWASDGSFNGTGLLKDINTTAKGITEPDSYPESLIEVNQILFFTADDGVNGRQLYTAGTRLVEFAQADFEIAVRDALFDLGTDPGPTIEDDDLVGVAFTRLVVEDIRLSDPSGIEVATDLEALGLAFNRISSLYTLTDMVNLRLLDLSSNQVGNDDLANISDLVNLEFLDLSNNFISDLTHMSTMVGLKQLRLENNAITDLSVFISKTIVTDGGRLMVRGNDLTQQTLCTVIPTLQSFGITVVFDGVCDTVVVPPDEFVTIKGVVFDAEDYGSVVSCATVIATNSQGEQIVSTVGFDGTYAFIRIPVDEYILEAQSPGFARTFATLTTSATGEVTINFPMEVRAVEGSVIGRVVGRVTGLALVGVRVDVFVDDVLVDTGYTCAEGRFEVRIPVAKGTNVRLEFSAPGFETRIVENPDLELDIELEPKSIVPGNIFGTVFDDALDAPVENANVFVTPSGQGTLSISLVTDSDGLFLVPNVGAGDFEIKVQAQGQEIVTETHHRSSDSEQSVVDIVLNRIASQGCGAGIARGGRGSGGIGDVMLVLLAIGALIGSRSDSNREKIFRANREVSHGQRRI